MANLRNAIDVRDVNQPGSQVAAILLGMVGLSIPNISPIFLGSAADRLGFDFEQIGMVMGVEILGVSLSTALAILWIHRLDWRRTALFALAVAAGGNILSAFITDFPLFLAVRGAVGLFGEGIAFAIGVAALGEVRNSDRAFAFLVGTQVALAVIGLLGLPYLEAIWGIAGITVPTALVILATMPMMRYLPRSLPDSVQASSDSAKASTAVYWGIAAQFTWYFGAVALYAFVERIGVDAGFEKTSIGLVLAIGMGASLIGSIIASWQGDRFSRIIPFVATMAVQCVFVLLLIDVETMRNYAIAWIVINAFWNYGLPYVYAGISAADETGRFVVMAPAAQGFGGAIGTTLAGFLVASMGLSAVVYMTIIANTIAAILFVRCVKLTEARD